MWVIIVSLLCLSACEGQVVTFDLSGCTPENTTSQVQKAFINLTVGVSEIWVNNIPDDVGFFIVQVHSHPYNVTLSSTPRMKNKTSVRGPNVGLVSFNRNDTIFYVKTKHQTRVLVVVMIYNSKDPIPGGCNLTFDTEYAPYQLVSYTEGVIIVQSQAPSAYNYSTCDKNDIQVDLYQLFLHDNIHDEAYYFNGIQNMLTVDLIKSHGRKVATSDGQNKYRKLYSAYRGVGQVFAIVATYQNRSSAYVPAVSYGCDITSTDSYETCHAPLRGPTLRFFLFVTGPFLVFFGHRNFRWGLFCVPCYVTILASYSLVYIMSSDMRGSADYGGIPIIMGAIFGWIWNILWCKIGIPVLAVSLNFIMVGSLVASVVFYAGVADFEIFHNDVNFWMTFVAIVLVFFTILTSKASKGHIFGCCFLGAYAFVIALESLIGGHLEYIVYNTLRRAVVRDFNVATIDPPFQIMDVVLSILWVVLTSVGLCYQVMQQRKEPPFPPNKFHGCDDLEPYLLAQEDDYHQEYTM